MINVRLDDYTLLLLEKLKEKTDKDRSKVIRAAIEFYAMSEMTDEEVVNCRLETLSNKL